MVEHVTREFPDLQCNLHQSIGGNELYLMCNILLKRGLDRLFNDEYWYEYTRTEKQILRRRTVILTAFAFMENTLEGDERRHYAREILARILEPSDQLRQFSDEDIDEILRNYRGLYYPLNFFRSAVRELGNYSHWDLDFEEKKLYKSYEIKCMNYNHNGEEWYEKRSTPQIIHGTGPHAIIHINWKNYDFGK
jgi:hypothetical protein